jgi:hypothetical protein
VLNAVVALSLLHLLRGTLTSRSCDFQQVNPLVEHLKEQLAKPPARLDRRESVSKLFDQSETFAAFRQGKGASSEEGEAQQAESPAPKAGDGQEHKRADSARQWDADSGMRAEVALNAYLQEQGGGSLGQSFVSAEDAEGDQAKGEVEGEVNAESSLPESSAGNLGMPSDDYDEENADYTSWALQGERSNSPQGGPGALGSIAVDRDTVIKKNVLGGTVSTYKHKHDLRGQLERKAGLKYIREKREQVRAREAVAKQAEEKVAIAQGHVDECEGKMAKLREEAEQLHHADQFGNRDKVRALQQRIAAIGEKLKEAQRELEREAEVEYLARREYNNAEIELRKVEELEPELIMEEDLANAEARVLAHLRAEKERDAALRFESLRQQRAQAAAEQRQKDVEKTVEAASIAKAGRVAAIKRVKQARLCQSQAQAQFEDARGSERDKKAAALVELKGNMEKAKDEIVAGNERKYKKIRAVQAQRKAEKAEIMAAGGNPYAVWRQQEQAKIAEKQKQERELKMKEMENKLLHQVRDE